MNIFNKFIYFILIVWLSCFPSMAMEVQNDGNNFETPIIDLSLRKEKISNFARNLEFKAREAAQHFKKHQNDYSLKVANIKSSEEYVAAAQTNIINAIFEKGFVIRTNASWRVAFFTSDGGGFPEKMTALGTFNGAGNVITFFPANGKTPSLTIKDFKGERAYIAYFEKGVSKNGWQRLGRDGVAGSQEVPEKELDDPIDFLKF